MLSVSRHPLYPLFVPGLALFIAQRPYSSQDPIQIPMTELSGISCGHACANLRVGDE